MLYLRAMLRSCLLIVATEKTKEDHKGIQASSCTKIDTKLAGYCRVDSQRDLESPLGFPEEMSKCEWHPPMGWGATLNRKDKVN